MAMPRRSSWPTDASVPSSVGFWSAVCACWPAAHAEPTNVLAMASPQHTRERRRERGNRAVTPTDYRPSAGYLRAATRRMR